MVNPASHQSSTHKCSEEKNDEDYCEIGVEVEVECENCQGVEANKMVMKNKKEIESSCGHGDPNKPNSLFPGLLLDKCFMLFFLFDQGVLIAE